MCRIYTCLSISTCKAPPDSPDHPQSSASIVQLRRSSVCLHNRHRTTVRTFTLFDLFARLHRTITLIFTPKMSTAKIFYNMRQPIYPSSSVRGSKASNMTSNQHYTTSPLNAFARDWFRALKLILHRPTSTLLEYRSHDTLDYAVLWQ